MTSAMLAAKKGREAQLAVLNDYLAGKEVTFKNHQGAVRPFTIQYDPAIEDKPTRAETKIKFDNASVFLDAAAQSDEAQVEKMLKEGMVDPNVPNSDGLTALHQACIENSMKVINILLEYKADVNAKDNDWWTPMHAASACSHWRVINLLISNGADVAAVNADGDLAVDLAEGAKCKQILEKELEAQGLDDAALDEKREAEATALEKQIQSMIDAGEDLNKPNEDGVTLLHCAASNGWESLVRKLCEQKVNVDPVDEDGDTPLMLAVCFAHYKTVEILAGAGAALGARNRHKEDAMFFAEYLEDGTMVRILKALINKQKAGSLASDAKKRNRQTGTSYKRKSFADKHDFVAKQNMKKEQEIAEMYAKMEQQGKVVYSGSDSEDDNAEKPVENIAVYSTPRKMSAEEKETIKAEAKKEKENKKDTKKKEKKRSSTGTREGDANVTPSLGTMARRSSALEPEKEDKKKKKKKGGCTIL
eukprot:m.35698 g.35698  ORF g.35698 m.35698 type:complete len:476 (+) comp8931_c0_seq1:257-1684(+)